MAAADHMSEFPRLFEAQYRHFTEDLSLWRSLAERSGGPVLELGCGPGRVLFSLAALGFQVTGIDRDPAMLARARQSMPPHLAPQITLHLADVTEFRLAQHFPLAVAACNTFAELDHAAIQRALENVLAHLLRPGLLALDLPNPAEALLDLPDAHEPLISFLDPESGNPIQIYAEHDFAPQSDQVTIVWSYDELLPNGHVRRHPITSHIHLRSRDLMQGLLSAAGFEQISYYGGYRFEELKPRSERMVILARAPAV